MINYKNQSELEELIVDYVARTYNIPIELPLNYDKYVKIPSVIKSYKKENRYFYRAFKHDTIINLCIFDDEDKTKIKVSSYNLIRQQESIQTPRTIVIPPTPQRQMIPLSKVKGWYMQSLKNLKDLSPNFPYLLSHLLTLQDLETYKIGCFKDVKTGEPYALICPIYNQKNELISLQQIIPGKRIKLTLEGTNSSGGLYLLEKRDGERKCLIVEGVADGIHLHKALGCNVLISYGKSNFNSVFNYATRLELDPLVIIDNDTNHASENECKKYDLPYLNLFDRLPFECKDITDFIIEYKKDYTKLVELYQLATGQIPKGKSYLYVIDNSNIMKAPYFEEEETKKHILKFANMLQAQFKIELRDQAIALSLTSPKLAEPMEIEYSLLAYKKAKILRMIENDIYNEYGKIDPERHPKIELT